MVKYKINKGFISQNIGSKITIFDPELSFLYTFNETAAFIFRKLKMGAPIEAIVKDLMKKYKIGKAKAEKDTKNLLRDLLEKKIIN